MAIEDEEQEQTQGRMKFLVSAIAIVIAQCLLLFGIALRGSEGEGPAVILLPLVVLVFGFFLCDRSSRKFLEVGRHRTDQKSDESELVSAFRDKTKDWAWDASKLKHEQRLLDGEKSVVASKYNAECNFLVNQARKSLDRATWCLYFGFAVLFLVLINYSDLDFWLWKIT